ncbi:MAG TPA: S26 family signal peptidase [Thermoplasmata archaeon]|nr:S26 family signal peptidase [Thermoplasmata archaeon]
MARHPPVDDEEDPGDEEEDLDEEPAPRARPRRPPPRRKPRRDGRPTPVRRWSASGSAEGDEEEDDEEQEKKRSWWHRDRAPVFWRARDSLYFGPLVALAIVVLLVVAMFAYTQNWPPVYVVESPSMQHGPNDVLGVINTGDLVLAEKVPSSSIQTYVQGLRTGYSTYGEFGDVLLYWPNGGGSTPIIHRAIVYLEYDPAVNGYNISSLAGLPCQTPGAVYETPETIGNCQTTGLTGTLELFGIGWASANVTVDLNPAMLGNHSGYLTMGDNNFLGSGAPNAGCSSDCQGLPDQEDGLSALVEPGWVLGVARGMLPWFGAFKLALEGNTQYVPAQSWQFMGITIAGLIGLAVGIHYAVRAEGIEDPRRREQEEEEEEEDEEDELEATPSSRSRRFLRSLRPWAASDEEEDDDEVPVRRPPARPVKPPNRRGRPRPHVRRGPKPKPRRPPPDQDDDDR